MEKMDVMIKPLIAPKRVVCARPGCGRTFVPYRPQNIYCSDKCQETDYNEKNDIAGQLRKMRVARKRSLNKKNSA